LIKVLATEQCALEIVDSDDAKYDVEEKRNNKDTNDAWYRHKKCLYTDSESFVSAYNSEGSKNSEQSENLNDFEFPRQEYRCQGDDNHEDINDIPPILEVSHISVEE
jgi:hypothetical protein